MKLKKGDTFFTYEADLNNDSFPIKFYKHRVREVVDFPPAPYFDGKYQHSAKDCFKTKVQAIEYLVKRLNKIKHKEQDKASREFGV